MKFTLYAYFHWIFFRRYQIFPSFYRIFQRETSGEFDGKIRCCHPLSSLDKLGKRAVASTTDKTHRKGSSQCCPVQRERVSPWCQPNDLVHVAGLTYAMMREALPNGASSRGNTCHILLKTLVRPWCQRCPANVRQEALPVCLHSIKPYREADWEPKKPHKGQQSGLLSPPQLAAQSFFRA